MKPRTSIDIQLNVESPDRATILISMNSESPTAASNAAMKLYTALRKNLQKAEDDDDAG